MNWQATVVSPEFFDRLLAMGYEPNEPTQRAAARMRETVVRE